MKAKLLIFLMIISASIAWGAFWFGILKMPNEHSEVSEAQEEKLAEFVNQTFAENRQQPPEESKPAMKSPAKNNPPPPASSSEVCMDEQKTDFDCYQKYYAELVQSQGVKAAFADLRQSYDTNSYVKSQCHPLTHVLGRVNSQNHQAVAEAFAEGESFCWSGYYHGVMEGIIGRIGYENLTSQMDGICEPLAETKQYQFDHYNCVHGLGHGVMAITNDELFESLEICDALTDSWERASCWSGVFMENIIIDGLNHVTNYLRPSEPLYPCTAVGDQYKATCYLMQTSYMLKVVNGDYRKVFGLCSEVEEAHRPTCYQSLGRDISGRSVSNVQATAAGCALGSDREQREHCIIGAVKDFISYFHSDTQAKELCAALTEEEVRVTCFQTAERYYKIF